MSNLHFELLTANQKRTLASLRTFSKYGILGGGTALSLHLCHRKSYDLDIFVPKPISKKFLFNIKHHFKQIKILVDSSDELSFISPFNVKISFVYYPFPPIYKTIQTPHLRLFSWKEIGLDKAHTIGRRGEWRDYIDIYFIIKKGFSLENIIQASKKKFGDLFSEKLFLSQLCYFGDVKDFSIEFMEERVNREQLQKFFEREIKKIKI